MSRVNARIDEHTEARIAWLTEATGLSVSHVLREGVALYHAEVLAGQGDSERDDIASDVKRHLAEALHAKHMMSSDAAAAPPRP
jgi:hypothetical protein